MIPIYQLNKSTIYQEFLVGINVQLCTTLGLLVPVATTCIVPVPYQQYYYQYYQYLYRYNVRYRRPIHVLPVGSIHVLGFKLLRALLDYQTFRNIRDAHNFPFSVESAHITGLGFDPMPCNVLMPLFCPTSQFGSSRVHPTIHVVLHEILILRIQYYQVTTTSRATGAPSGGCDTPVAVPRGDGRIHSLLQTAGLDELGPLLSLRKTQALVCRYSVTAKRRRSRLDPH